MKFFRKTLLLVCCFTALAQLRAQDYSEEVQKGKDLFSNGQYEAAVTAFEAALKAPNAPADLTEATHGMAIAQREYIAHLKKELANSQADNQALESEIAMKLEKNYDKSLRLAIKAWKTADTPESRKALFEAYEAVVGPNVPVATKTWKDFANVGNVAYSPDRQRILSTNNNDAKIWAASNGELQVMLKGHEGPVWAVAFSPDGNFALTGSWDGTAKLWNSRSGALLHTFTGHQYAVHSVAFTPDGKYAVTGSWDGTAKLWDIETEANVRTFSGHKDAIWSVAISPEGTRLLTGSADNTAKVWDMATGNELANLEGHRYTVWNVSFSPANDAFADGRFVLTGSMDNTAKVWDAATGKLIHTINGDRGDVSVAAFSADGRYIMTGSSDKSASVWEFDPALMVEKLEKKIEEDMK